MFSTYGFLSLPVFGAIPKKTREGSRFILGKPVINGKINLSGKNRLLFWLGS
jgi:hypothetical protein